MTESMRTVRAQALEGQAEMVELESDALPVQEIVFRAPGEAVELVMSLAERRLRGNRSWDKTSNFPRRPGSWRTSYFPRSRNSAKRNAHSAPGAARPSVGLYVTVSVGERSQVFSFHEFVSVLGLRASPAQGNV